MSFLLPSVRQAIDAYLDRCEYPDFQYYPLLTDLTESVKSVYQSFI